MSSRAKPPDAADGELPAWLRTPISTAFARLDSGPRGLSEPVAERRLAESGPNEPVAKPEVSLASLAAKRLASPLVAILVLSSVASAFLRDLLNAAIILAIVAFSVVLELVQTRRSMAAENALRARVAPTAAVIRDGRAREVPRAAIVPGDLVALSAGDLVPADALLVEARDLHVQEAALTGESLPVEKEAHDPAPGVEPSARAVWMGSSVVSGTATALVIATGRRTTFGAIAESLASDPGETEFERGLAAFGAFILNTVVFLVLFVFFVAAVLKRDPLESLLFAVALAVGLTPEFLPMITTVTLARGAVRMAEQKVIVKNLAAIQNLGSIDVLLSDKTGTLTTGEMELVLHVDARGEVSERALLLATVNSYFESGIADPADAALLRKAHPNALDSAVLRHPHPDISGYEKHDEVPFDFERRMVSVIARRAGRTLLVTKGAPENVLAASGSLEIAGARLDLDEAARARAREVTASLGAEGYRVLAVAYAERDDKPRWDKSDERDLVLAGFLAFVDPPRADAAPVVASLRELGVAVKIVSGDAELVAAHVARAVGIDATDMLVGAEIDGMTDGALAQRAERANVFARVTPGQKTRILRAVASRGHVVGYLGDGVNDAPSLHAADVGISVDGAVDVARDAADVILLEHDLRVVHAGITLGRRAFGNVMKYLLMGTSSNFGNMFSMAGAALFLPFLPMLPTQILLNNFLYDVAQLTIPGDRVDESFVRRPRRWDMRAVRRFMLVVGPISSIYDFLTFFVLLEVLHADERLFHTGWFVESLATQTLVIFVIRTRGSPFASRPSRGLVASTLAVVATALALPLTPLAAPLGLAPLPLSFFVFLAGATVTYLALVEAAKRRVLDA